jgi:transcriptional regulator with XRE-family HTH domain
MTQENENKTPHPPNRLREQRERSRLTVSEVARFLDVSIATVSRHETSNRGLTRNMIEKYAGLYKVTSAELFIDLPEYPTETPTE